MVDHFHHRERPKAEGTPGAPVLHAEDVPLPEIATRFGTPTYVYSRATITRHVEVLRQAMAALPHQICYAVKANGNLAILDLVARLGCGFDAVSLGELRRVQQVGGDPQRTLVSGVGKRDDEIAAALRANVLYLCAESEDEVHAIARIAAELGVRARVSVRVNPEVDAQTHPYIATGLRKNKFGIPWDAAVPLYERFAASPTLEWVGVTCHIGSQITTLAPFEDTAQRMAGLARTLLARGLPIRYLGMGGGLGVPYGNETPPSPEVYGAALVRTLKPLGLTVILEPGRVIVGNAGVLLTRVTRTKQGAERRFVIVDAGMNDLLRPALYQARHTVVAVTPAPFALTEVDLVGPVCESADTFAAGVSLPPLSEGDLLVLRTAGAYGFAMASQYNGRPRAAEVMVDGAQAFLVRERESDADLWRGEHALPADPS